MKLNYIAQYQGKKFLCAISHGHGPTPTAYPRPRLLTDEEIQRTPWMAAMSVRTMRFVDAVQRFRPYDLADA